jgi:hypothetical protein
MTIDASSSVTCLNCVLVTVKLKYSILKYILLMITQRPRRKRDYWYGFSSLRMDKDKDIRHYKTWFDDCPSLIVKRQLIHSLVVSIEVFNLGLATGRCSVIWRPS